ncbi:glycoside hydrolase family 15 [archaeon]|jgi:GH15 family glucan-1,4-alpha-glucosidase|nr:glycoside hydrolase family 15 [archaeon]MBT4351742.1 glycoside hydrolase family 15 [archaeon]MBT4646749.1 glycoside hydrolase family 15 [archaeon]MBT6822042.1 glycoside hydrolase family 15 [archaeon]
MIKKFLLKERSKAILRSLRYESGLFAASKKNVETGYNKAWIRDNIYEALGFEAIKDINSIRKTYAALFDILLKHEDKINWAIKEKPDAAYKYIHARFCPITFDEFHENWGNKQNDAIGAFLFKVGDMYEKKVHLFRDNNDINILQKLVKYLESIEYWHDSDHGVWENEEEIHASSVGACLAGLKKIKQLVHVPDYLIENGENALNELLPRESVSKETDLALLTLIYPYKVVSDEMTKKILFDVETKLVRDKGVVRYFGDWYYNNGQEAEWVMGLAWLAKIYKDLGNKVRYKHYMKKLYSCVNWKGELPELYYAGTKDHNENTPLGWTQAMYLVAVS